MPPETQESPPPRRFVGVGIDTYKHFDLLEGIPKLVEISEVLEQAGYVAHLVKNPNDNQAEKSLTKLLPAGGLPDATLVVLWSGHGETTETGLRLITSSAKPGEGSTRTSRQLVEFVMRTKAKQILILLDTCYSGAAVPSGAEVIASIRDSFPDTDSWVGFIGSARSFERARAGLFGQELLRILVHGPQDADLKLRFNQMNIEVSGEDLMNALISDWPDLGQRPQKLIQGEVSRKMFRNPLYRNEPGRQISVDDLVDEAEQSVARRASFLAGVDGPLKLLLEWIEKPGPGTISVVGLAGSGKTSLVASLSTLSMKVGGGPARTGVDAFVHMRGNPSHALAVELDGQLRQRGMLAGAPAVSEMNDLIGVLNANWAVAKWATEEPRLPLIVLDGLDESPESLDFVNGLVNRLGEVSKLVATSRSGPAIDKFSAPLGGGPLVLDLEDEEWLGPIEREVTSLISARRPASDIGVEEVARFARDGSGPFLAARLLTSSLYPPYAETLPDADSLSLADLVRKAIGKVDGFTPSGIEGWLAVRDLLRGLLVVYGAGAPDDIWPVLASATTGRPYTRNDVYWALPRLGPLVTATAEDGTAVFRATNPSLAAAATLPQNRQPMGNYGEERIASALVAYYLDLLRAGGRRQDSAYLSKYIVLHCIDAGRDGVGLIRQLGPRFARDLARTLSGVASIESEQGNASEAIVLSLEAVEVWRRVSEVSPEARSSLAKSLAALGRQYHIAGDRSEELFATSEAADIRLSLAIRNHEYLSELAATLARLALQLSSPKLNLHPLVGQAYRHVMAAIDSLAKIKSDAQATDALSSGIYLLWPDNGPTAARRVSAAIALIEEIRSDVEQTVSESLFYDLSSHAEKGAARPDVFRDKPESTQNKIEPPKSQL